MDLLRRYQKPGGFLQLVQLIETCGPQKQQQLLTSIEKESLEWANEVRAKILTINRIFSWDEQTLAELMSRVQELTLSIAVHGIAPEVWERSTKSLSHGQRRRIDDLSKTKAPSPAEIAMAFTKIIAEIREMISLGYLHLTKVDPGLVIETDIEDKLGKRGNGSVQPSGHSMSSAAKSSSSNSMHMQATPPSSSSSAHSSLSRDEILTPASGSLSELGTEVAKLRKDNLELKKEAQSLANEVNQLRTILAQVRKTVA